jgi:hypothetical protein
MGTISGPFSIPDGLIYHIDPANPKSYIGTGTTIYDLSGNGNTSNFTNGALYQNYQKGVVLVDGNNDYISTPLFNLTSPVTVSAWVKNVVNLSPVFGGSGGGVGYGNGEYIFYYENKTIVIQGNNSGAKYFQFPQLNLNQWSNLVMTRDASNNMSVYLNGIGSISNSQSYSNTLQMNQIGRYSAFTNIYNVKGSIGEVRIYNKALSASEVLQNYNATKKRYVPEENIVRNGLVLNLDAANPSSYVGSGNTINGLVGGVGGTLFYGTGFSTADGGSFFLDGSYAVGGNNNYIYAPINTGLFSNEATMIIWLKNDLAIPSTYNTGFLGFGQGQVNDHYPYVDGVAYLSTFRNVRVDAIQLSSTINRALPHMVSVTTDSSNWKLYQNATLQHTTSSTGSVYLSRFTIGYSINAFFYRGNIYAFMIYNRALTESEISQNYNAMRNRFGV